MKARYIWLAIGLAFAVALAITVGQRLSAEAMAVVVGVVAGVAASIPTSLIVVWIAMRSINSSDEREPRLASEARSAEPRIVVVTAPTAPAPPMYPAGYMAAPSLAGYPAAPRRFTLVGGADVAFDNAPQPLEALWAQ